MIGHTILHALLLPAALLAAPGPGAVPDEALAAMRAGRFYRASVILDEYIAATRDTAPATTLLAARAAAGWGDWTKVEQLLGGRAWLETEEQAAGLSLLGWSRLERNEAGPAAETLRRYLSVAPDAPARMRGMAAIRMAIALRDDDATAALAAYDTAAALLPDIARWIDLEAAETAAEAGDTTALRVRLDRLDPATDDAWRLRVEAFRVAEDLARAIDIAESAASTLTGSARARASNLAAEMHLEAGDTAAARRAYRRTLDLGSGTLEAARGYLELGGTLTPEDHLRVGRLYARNGNATRGIDHVEAWLESGEGSARERERVRLELAYDLFGSGRYDDARTWFARVAENASSNGIAAEALFYSGRSQYRSGSVTQGRTTFEQVAERFPTQDFGARAFYFMADLDQDDGDIAQAKARFRRAVESGSDIEEVGFAQMRLGGLAFLEEDFEGAAREFDTYRNRYPTGRRWTQATYWSALAHLELGHDSIANARFRDLRRVDPLSYYGGQAAERLGQDLLDIPLTGSPARDENAEQQVEQALATFDLLRELGWSGAASDELDRVRSRLMRSDATAYAFAEALAGRGLGMTAVGIGWDLFSRAGGWNERLLRIIYPMPWRALIEAEAERLDIDPWLAAGLIRQESMFQPDARSGAGAVGLMQVLPATGEAVARAVDIPRFDADMLRMPEINVILGVQYLADQLETFDHRLPLVLGAYNAGPHRIDRWSAFPEFADDELFTERIPFTETREYVKIVQQNARIYRSLYGG